VRPRLLVELARVEVDDAGGEHLRRLEQDEVVRLVGGEQEVPPVVDDGMDRSAREPTPHAAARPREQHRGHAERVGDADDLLWPLVAQPIFVSVRGLSRDAISYLAAAYPSQSLDERTRFETTALDIRFGRAVPLISGNSLLLETTLGLTQKGSPLGSARLRRSLECVNRVV